MGQSATVQTEFASAERASDDTVEQQFLAVESSTMVRQVFQRSFSTRGPGRGIGTYSIKLLTERYLGGRVGFSSSAAEGTTFYADLPV